jgi:WS/DGAT/MGAT family acyltransferase
VTHLSATDAALLATENREEPGHAGTLMIFGPGRDGRLTYRAVRELVEARLPLVTLGRSVVSAPLGGLVRPSWEPARNFHADDHVRRMQLPTDRWEGALGRFLADNHGTLLDRERPLWELWVIDGLPEEHVAVYCKIHVALFDDLTGTQLLTAILDDDEHGRPDPPPDVPSPAARPPSPFDALGRLIGPVPSQVRHAAGFPRRVTERTVRAVRDQLPGWLEATTEMTRRTPELDRIARLLPAAKPRDGDTQHATLRAPRLSFNEAITARRTLFFGRLPIEDVLAVKHATGTSFNDVLVAVSAGALRQWLIDHDELPTTPAVALVPMLVRGSKGRDDAIAAGMIIPLPTNVDDPLERLRRADGALGLAKERHRALPASVMLDVSMFAPASVSVMASRLVKALPYRSFVGPQVNVAITNVPGTRQATFLAGCPLVSSHPLPPITNTTTLNIGFQSSADFVGVGAVSCRDTMRDLDDLVNAMPVELDRLLAAAKG